MNPSVSIVIPTFNRYDLVQELLDGITEKVDQVIVVDDCSSEVAELQTDLPVFVASTPKRSGFTLASNYGLKLALAPFAQPSAVFLISNDVRFHGKFIQQSLDILLGAKQALVGNRHINFDSGWNTFNGKTFDYLEGFFLAATSDGWRDLGFFDENYAPHDFEDVDLSTTAKQKGYKLVSLNNPNIVHMGAQSIGYNPERETITRRNREYFQRKWLSE